MTEGEVYRVAMAFDHLAHTFEAGHAIRLVVTSSNYPQYNRNMNTGGEMYPEGNLDTLVSPEIANNSVHVLGSYLSRITLPLQSMTSSDMAVLTPPAVWITPNPANTEFIVNAIDQGCTLHVLDISGRTMARILAPGDQVTIDTHLLPEGLYIVFIRCVGDTRSAKVLVHHP